MQTVWSIVVLIIAIAASGAALRCYTCNSSNDPNCKVPNFVPLPSQIRECSDKQLACGLTVLATVEQPDDVEKIVIGRSCITSPNLCGDFKKFVQTHKPNHRAFSCRACGEELCNGHCNTTLCTNLKSVFSSDPKEILQLVGEFEESELGDTRSGRNATF